MELNLDYTQNSLLQQAKLQVIEKVLNETKTRPEAAKLLGLTPRTLSKEISRNFSLHKFKISGSSHLTNEVKERIYSLFMFQNYSLKMIMNEFNISRLRITAVLKPILGNKEYTKLVARNRHLNTKEYKENLEKRRVNGENNNDRGVSNKETVERA